MTYRFNSKRYAKPDDLLPLVQTYREMHPQVVAAWQYAADMWADDKREDECWRMFGITVEYLMDERIVLTP